MWYVFSISCTFLYQIILLHSLFLLPSSRPYTRKIFKLTYCTAAAMQKAYSSPATSNIDQVSPTTLAFIKVLFSSSNPTLNSIVVSFLNAIHSQSASLPTTSQITQTLNNETELFVHNLDSPTSSPAPSLPHLSSSSFRLAVLSSLLDIQLARDIVDRFAAQILTYLSSLLEKYV
jgi:hypothetical protein